ncbi:probable signal peptidase complex subunit 2 [Selaginella moellendorffii]|uniref:probable signal peptidase complex subunit 2 n=1 Tax=Selaginella moellendorffii TaxID=88036 RepID=UPI000D1CCFED|nr:probable signal peptidase complex subunit 2 [Selaginella moellendorffii]XP_024529840.1 probable signal peptidase complex subunit 2 [Selaginella moellendorffii]|eukprot:XP_024519463.1 probable signal peptidase complex subunit 2 [Selaginella moellendorffii]
MGEAKAAAAVKKVNLSDHFAIKRMLDETVSEVIGDMGFKENVTVSNMKLGLGFLACLVALAAQLYPKKFPENKPVLLVCIALYVVLNLAIQAIVYFKEKNNIVVTYPFPGSFTSTGLAISSKLPRHSPKYTLRIASADPGHISAHSPVEFTKSVTKWFSSEGVFAEALFWEDVRKLVEDYDKDRKEISKSK